MTLRKSVKFSTYQQLSLKRWYSSHLYLQAFVVANERAEVPKFFFFNLVLKTLSSFSKLHFPVLLLFCNVFLCCTVESFIRERIVSLPYFTIKATVL